MPNHFLIHLFSTFGEKFIHLFFALLGLHCCEGFSLALESSGYSLVVVHRLLIAVASLAVEHGL